jgi:predicted dinucleotide-binding enzyme
MKIAIIGAGNVGGALGRGWTAAGHEVVFGVRDPKDPKVVELLEGAKGRARAATLREAAGAGDVIVFATPWSATRDAVSATGSLSGKIVIDATNPLKPDLSGLAIGHSTSAAEQIAGWTGGARVVRPSTRSGAAHDGPPLRRSAGHHVPLW